MRAGRNAPHILMKTSNTRAAAWLLAGLVGGTALPCAAQDANPGANTVIGTNVLLADGAAALMSGDWQRGIDLTQLGLAGTVSRNDQSAGLANLCAGYAQLKQFAKALEFCDRSIAVIEDNWRVWQNRAACHLGLGKVEEALQDIQRGLQLNPDSEALQKTLAIARDHEKLQQERMQHLLES
jgi:tetratricopeptide (TPR) repeat protein